MITNFKLFEKKLIDESIHHTIVLDDLIKYYKQKYNIDDPDTHIRDFIFSLYNKENIKVAFSCRKCTFDDMNGARNFVHCNKSHKGEISGLSYGFSNDIDVIFLTLTLYRIKYDHDVDTSEPIVIFGKISKELEDVIEDVNMMKDLNKYNI